MKATDVVSHDLIFIDQDTKVFKLDGEGLAYNRPWGTKKNVVFKNLTPFKGKEFHVERTDKVRNGYWYYGYLEGEKVWIHHSRLIE
ncbi:SH3-like domain-containing protein [Pseudogracilibacillus sp. SE30717A]|uniref:SH3-like domain-containing protein n=1 Tax=Pseudogracilibacillus sp. SE30717A TaxID=3098293 RepID=UPI003FA6DBCD